MTDADQIFDFVESLIYEHSQTHCSDLQRIILGAVLQGERKTYEQIAEECGYSAKYVKQDVAPKLWHLLSEALGQKVSKANARAILVQEHRKQPTAESSAPQPIPALSISRKSTILLVDDQPKNLRLLSDVLEEEGYEIQQAINGTVALEAVAIAPPDLILLDICMPELDGYTVCQKLKASSQTQDIPVIFVSALDEAWDKVKAFSVGGVDYISKPFKVVEVLARVENQLKIQQLQQELKAQNAHLRQALQELSRFAAIDSMTQLASRQRFEAYLEDQWQRAIAQQIPLTLLLCQVDGLSAKNLDKHQENQTCLYQVGRIIRQMVQRDEDFVGRYGAVTFAIALPNLAQADADPLAEQLIEKFRDLELALPTNTEPETGPETGPETVTLSIGYGSQEPGEGDKVADLITGCDRALQKVVEQGGDGFAKL